MHIYGLGYFLAGIMGIILIVSYFSGEVPGGRRGRNRVRRRETPQLYWTNIGCLAAMIAVGLAFGLLGYIRDHGL